MKKSRLLGAVCACATALVFFTTANAATLLIDSSGKLTGATDVDVDSSLYDVYFMDGTCNSLFNGCTEFTFTDFASAGLASQALLDQVFLGIYDTVANKTNGIEVSGNQVHGSIYTPYARSSQTDDAFTRMVRNYETGFSDSVYSDTQLRAYDDDLTLKAYAVYAVWTEAGAGAPTISEPISSVPIPAAAWLFGSGLLGLIGVARRKNS